MMYLLLDICMDSRVLRLIYFIKTIIGILSIIVPILLVVILMIKTIGALLKNDADSLAAIKGIFISRIIASVIVFLVPTFVDMFLKMVNVKDSYAECYNNATVEIIELAQGNEKAQKELEAELKRQQFEKNEAALKQAEENARKARESLNASTGNNVDTSNYSGPVETVNISYIKTDDFVIPLYYSDHISIIKSLPVNSAITSQIHSILSNVAVYVSAHPDYIPRFETAGAYVGKDGWHGKGLAIDLFNNWVYKDPISGKAYTPYGGQGTGIWNEYKRFICDVCNGKENCKYNIAYIIYESYFKGNGWCWGGTWGPASFDPMHYELPNHACFTSNKASITC